MSTSIVDYKLIVNQGGWKKAEINGETVHIPLHWTVEAVSSLAPLSKARTNQPTEKYIGLESISQGTRRLIKNDEKKLVGNSTANLFERGSVLFSKLRPYLRKAWVAEFEGSCSTELLVLQPKHIHSELLISHLLSDKAIEKFSGQSEGTHMPRSDWATIGHWQIATPPFPEQQLIASVLSTQESRLEDLRTWSKVERQRLIWLTEELLSGRVRVAEHQGDTERVIESDENGVAQEVLGNFELVANMDGWKQIEINGANTLIPATWRTAKIGEEIRFTLGHTPAKEGNNYQGETPWVTISNMHGRTITKHSGKISSTKTRILPKGSLVGSFKMTVGRFAILGMNAITNEAIVGAAPDDAPNHDLNYLRLSLVSPFKNGASTNGQGVQLLNTKTINNLYFVAPEKEEQQLISQVISSQESHVEDIETLIVLEQKRLSWLTEELLSGRVRVEASSN